MKFKEYVKRCNDLLNRYPSSGDFDVIYCSYEEEKEKLKYDNTKRIKNR